MARHLHVSQRLAWHDRGWDGRVCNRPDMQLECWLNARHSADFNIRVEQAEAGKRWIPVNIPDTKRRYRLPCWATVNLYGAEPMSYRPVVRSNVYVARKRQLKFTARDWRLDPGDFVFTPHLAMLRRRKSTGEVDEDNPWLKHPEEEQHVLDGFWGRIAERQSLAFFYVEGHHPWTEVCATLPVGLSLVTKKWPQDFHASKHTLKAPYPIWARRLAQGWPDAGFRIPWHALDEADANELAAMASLGTLEYPKYGCEAMNHLRLLPFAELLLNLGKRLLGKYQALIGNYGWLASAVEKLRNYRVLRPSLRFFLEGIGIEGADGMAADLEAAAAALNIDPACILLSDDVSPLPSYVDPADLEKARQQLRQTSQTERDWKLVLSQVELRDYAHFSMLASSGPLKRRGVSDPLERLIQNPYLLIEMDEGTQSFEGPNHRWRLQLEQLSRSLEGEAPPVSLLCQIPGNDGRRLQGKLHDLVYRAAEEQGCTRVPEHILTSDAAELVQSCLNGRESSLLGSRIRVEVEEGQVFASVRKWRETEQRIANRIASVEHAAMRYEEIRPAGGETHFMMRRGVLVLCGPAGSGKSSALLKGFQDPMVRQAFGRCAILAPTGRAASILSEMFLRHGAAETLQGCDGPMTIHSFLSQHGRFPFVRTFQRTKSDINTLILDESSMIDVELFDALLAALDLRTLRRILLMGDDRQLAPVGPGKPFVDILQWLRETRPGAKVFEQEGGPRCKGPFTATLLEVIQSKRTSVGSIFAATAPAGASGTDVSVSRWHNSNELLRDVTYLSVLQEKRTEHTVSEFHVVSAYRDGVGGVDYLNRWLAKSRARGLPRVPVSRVGAEKGDKVVQTRNESVYCPAARCTAVICNGMLGRVVYAQPRAKTVNVEVGGKTVKKRRQPCVLVQYPDLGNQVYLYRLSQANRLLDLGFATTIHKVQGSTFGELVVVIPWRDEPLQQELLYTACSRHRFKVSLMFEHPKEVSEQQFMAREVRAAMPRRVTGLRKYLEQANRQATQE